MPITSPPIDRHHHPDRDVNVYAPLSLSAIYADFSAVGTDTTVCLSGVSLSRGENSRAAI
jgi:hypothetical protein